jgi:ribose transport system substrate-binding protein
MKKWITALTFALALLVLSACSVQPGKTAAETEAKKADTEKLLVGFSNWSRSFEFYVDIETGMKEKADELGIELITQDANSDLTEQTKQLENYITRKVDGIIIVPIDSEAAGDEVQMVNDAGIPIVTLDIAVTGGGTVNSHLESNNYMGGEKSADFIAEQLGGKGTVAVIDNPTITSLIARTDGFTNTIAEKYPDIEIVSIQSGDSDREKGMQVAENILQKYPDLDAIYCTNDAMGLGALQAVQAKGMKTIIIGFGAFEEALQEIKAGSNYKASFSQEPTSMGKAAMEVMAKILRGEEVESFIEVDVGLITAENVDNYLK